VPSDIQIKHALAIVEEAGLDLDLDRIYGMGDGEHCGCLMCRRHIIVNVICDLQAKGYKVVKV
jgi:hypothetical protein